MKMQGEKDDKRDEKKHVFALIFSYYVNEINLFVNAVRPT